MTHKHRERWSWQDGPLPPEIENLSDSRRLVLQCCFPPRPDKEEVVAAARDLEGYLRRSLDETQRETGSAIEIVRQIFAAGLLTFGHLEMVDVILENLPKRVQPGRNSRISLDSLRVAPDFLMRRARPI